MGQAHISGALVYGWQDITTDRTVTIASVDRLRARKSFAMPSAILTPRGRAA